MKILGKIDTRGGYHRPVKLKSSQALLLKYIWEKHGGVALVARKLGLRKQDLINWKLRNKVPLEMTGIVSRGLGILREGLSYIDHFQFFGYGNSWEWVVNQYGLDKKRIKIILKGKHPKIPKL